MTDKRKTRLSSGAAALKTDQPDEYVPSVCSNGVNGGGFDLVLLTPRPPYPPPPPLHSSPPEMWTFSYQALCLQATYPYRSAVCRYHEDFPISVSCLEETVSC